MEKKVFSVGGMSCGHCKNAVETAVAALAGVKSALVDLELEQLTVAFDPLAVQVDIIKSAIEEQGFEVSGLVEK